MQGAAEETGPGVRYGGYFLASGGDYSNYGLISFAWGGSSSNYAGYFGGDIYVGGSIIQPSDARLKLNEKKLDKALDKLMQLEPKSYEYDTLSHRELKLPAGEQVGLVAQDVEKVLPELVTEFAAPVDPSERANTATDEPETFKGLNYTGLIPVLVGAIKEQQATIEGLRERVEELENGRPW